jgi:hypothetical protein
MKEDKEEEGGIERAGPDAETLRVHDSDPVPQCGATGPEHAGGAIDAPQLRLWRRVADRRPHGAGSGADIKQAASAVQ